MSEIDWSKAPEGYPIWIQDLTPDGSGWHRDDGDRYTDQDGECWTKPDQGYYTVHERTAPQWSGEGLPPVGEVCEYLFSEGDEWRKGTVVAHYEGRAVVCDLEDDAAERVQERNLRPIRTPEQIAAEERSKECDRIYGIISSVDREGNRSDMAEALYDAGYRLITEEDE